MIDTVIFDVDGTLLDTEKIYMRAWQEAAALLGYPMPWEALVKTRALPAAAAIPIYREYCGDNFSFEAVYPERIRIGEEIIATSTPQQLQKPAAQDVLHFLRSKELKIAVASSTKYDKTVSHLDHAGLLEYFQAVVGGDMVSRGKPNPDIFLKAAALLDSDPATCLVVGDTPADVYAGSSAGMQVILIPDQVPANPETTALSWKVLDSLAQLPDLLY